MSLSNYAEQETLDHLLTLGPFYVGLHTTNPADDDSGSECVGATYVRQAVTLARTGTYVDNTGLVTFPESTDSWGVLTHFGVYDAVSGGNLIFYGTLENSKTVEAGETLTFPVGSIVHNAD